LRIVRALVAVIGISLSFVYLGCGNPALVPTISQVLPQMITAGSSGATVQITGKYFSNKAVVLWNGNPLSTTMVDGQHLSATVQGSNLAVPGTAHVEVQDNLTGQHSLAVPLMIASASTSTGTTVAPLAITTTSLASGIPGTSYTAGLAATGGTPGYSWTITSGQLPSGLTLAASSGIISGTPTASGTFSLGITVTDSSAPLQTATATLTLSIAAQHASSLVVSSATLPGATATHLYSGTLSAAGGTAPYTWSVTSGQLPSGLSLSASSGVISGTPAAAGTANFSVTVTDSGNPAQTASASTSIAIAAAGATPQSLAITSLTLPSGTNGTAYSQALQASGGTPGYTWSIISGSLPAGLGLANGVISGTPTSSGSFNFTASVADSGNPAQTKSAAMTLVVAVAGSSLAITTSSLPSATDGVGYSHALQASGGTPNYAWSITSGSLPNGLTLAPATGMISGMPVTSGISNFTATVSDNGNPVQTKSAAMTLVVAGSSLTITTSTLPSATNGTGYSQTLQASGGTPGYTWSVTAGSLPNGLTLAPTTGLITGTPTVSGVFNFTASVIDGGSPAQTQSIATSVVVAAAQAPGSGTTWYIRLDGGSNTQCTGTTNAAYPGSGSGMPCAYNHPYQMLDYNGHWVKFAGGDTIQFADPATNKTPYYMGEQNGGVGTDWSGQMGGACPHPNAGHAAGAGCILPIPPSGTALNPTRIIGQNAGSCHTSQHTGLVNPTILSGIAGAFAVLDVQGTSYVQLSCIELTQPDNCTNAGQGSGGGCGDLANYVSVGGIVLEYGNTAQGPSNFTMQDIAADGLAGYGIIGSHINTTSADVFTASDIYLIGNGGAGWNSDGGGCIATCESVGTMNLSYLDVEGNGCLLLKPFDVSQGLLANKFNYCFGQNTGGYGDGFVLIAAGDVTVNVSHSKFNYNTQDGFDGLHISDDVSTFPSLNISSSWAEGNAGQAIKIGTGAASTAINNVTISNCHILDDPSAFPNNPSGWIPLDGGDTCRASGNQWAFQMKNGSTLLLENNTIMGYGTTMFDLGCAPLDPACGSNGATVTEINDIHVGFPDPDNAGRLASGWYLEPGILATTVTADHNLWWNVRTLCPDNTIVGETNYVCADPLMVSESNVNSLNPNLTSGSPAIGAGVSITGITTDYNGATRPSPPAIGAIQ
jgi:hypothetical protein